MDCAHIPSIDYGEFSKRLFEKSIDSRIPITGTFDITSRCNLKCIHCYINGTCSGEELTYPEICGILDQIGDAGCLWLVLTGGEPLVRPDFKDIYRYAKSKGLFITLFTNGTLITPDIADFLADLPPFAIEISLYGISSDTYEKVTGQPDAFERCQRGIDLLLEKDLYIRLKSMIFSTNQHELIEMRQYAERLGVPFRFDCLINGKLDGSLEPLALRLSPEDIISLDFIDEKRTQGLCDFIDRFSTVPASEYLYNCGAGQNSFHITSTGHLEVCIVSHEPHYDLLGGTFHDGFYNAFTEVRVKKRSLYSECQTCELKGICAQCPAWGQLEHGDPEAKVDFLCQIAHLRYTAFLSGRYGRSEANTR